ncbi:MAG TPA: hypothetical protein VNX21_06975, partial [Candidatus Thermoplasmatota archaeon]|nr:hypothetical protein [Candidatus Thermoplasmatota archaeon]
RMEAPVPGRLHVALVDAEGRGIAESTGPEGELRAAELPAGEYRVVVRLVEGALATYEAEGTARLVLEPPDSFFNS